MCAKTIPVFLLWTESVSLADNRVPGRSNRGARPHAQNGAQSLTPEGIVELQRELPTPRKLRKPISAFPPHQCQFLFSRWL
jgi:hypothetical protein